MLRPYPPFWDAETFKVWAFLRENPDAPRGVRAIARALDFRSHATTCRAIKILKANGFLDTDLRAVLPDNYEAVRVRRDLLEGKWTTGAAIKLAALYKAYRTFMGTYPTREELVRLSGVSLRTLGNAVKKFGWQFAAADGRATVRAVKHFLDDLTGIVEDRGRPWELLYGRDSEFHDPEFREAVDKKAKALIAQLEALKAEDHSKRRDAATGKFRVVTVNPKYASAMYEVCRDLSRLYNEHPLSDESDVMRRLWSALEGWEVRERAWHQIWVNNRERVRLRVEAKQAGYKPPRLDCEVHCGVCDQHFASKALFERHLLGTSEPKKQYLHTVTHCAACARKRPHDTNGPLHLKQPWPKSHWKLVRARGSCVSTRKQHVVVWGSVTLGVRSGKEVRDSSARFQRRPGPGANRGPARGMSRVGCIKAL